jgi:hypothetical protein
MKDAMAVATGDVVNDFVGLITKQADAVGDTWVNFLSYFGPEWDKYSEKLTQIIAPSIIEFNKKLAEASIAPSSEFLSIMQEWIGKLVQQKGDKLEILDLERTQALAKLRQQLTDDAEFGAAALLINKYYDNEILNETLRRFEEEKKLQKEFMGKIVSDAKDAWEKIRQANLSGKNGLIAALGQNISDSTEIGKIISSGPFNAASTAGASFITTLVKLVMELENVNALLNPFITFLGAVFEVVGPMVNNLLAPLVGMLKLLGYVVGKLLAPALEILRPIIEAISLLFLFLYNSVIMPVANLLIRAFNVIYNGFATFINGIIWLVDQIPFVDMTGHYLTMKDINAGTLAAIDTTTIASTGTAGSSGNSASYAAGSSIRIESITINAGAVVGDTGLQNLAIIIRDEILEAERLGR